MANAKIVDILKAAAGFVVVASVWIGAVHGLAGGGRALTGAPERHTSSHELDTEVAKTCVDFDRVATGNVVLHLV